MNKEEINENFKLESTEAFGVVSYDQVMGEAEWKAEELSRMKAFSKYQPFVKEITESIKEVMRFGVPCPHRRKMWLIASGGYDLLQEVGNIYDSCLLSSLKEPFTETSIFGINIELLNFLPAQTYDTLKIFLQVVWRTNTSIQFAPIIPAVSAILLLFMEPSLAYITIQSMINRSKTDGWYFTLTKEKFLASAQAAHDIAYRRCRSVVDHAEQMGLSIAQIFLTLLPSFFLPFTTLPVALTLFDSFIVEGRKILTRLCIGLLVSQKKTLLKTNDSHSFLSVIIDTIEGLDHVENMKQTLRDSFTISISRSRHIYPRESLAIQRKHGILNQRVIINAPHVMSMANAEILQRRNSIPSHVVQFFSRCETTMSTQFAHHIYQDCLPEVMSGELLTDSLFFMIRQHLPQMYNRYSANLVYSIHTDGTTLSSLLSKEVKNKPHILVIKTDHKLFGAFLSEPIKLTGRTDGFYGNSFTFVFDADESIVYQTSPCQNYSFISCYSDIILIGGPKPAIFLQDGFKVVFSDPCDTFKSPAFTLERSGDRVLDIELYSLGFKHTFI